MRSRWNAGSLLDPADQFAALYFGDSPLVAQFEVGAMLGSLTPGGNMPNPGQSNFVILNVRIILHDVIDLTEVTSTQIPLETNAQELTGDWRGYRSRRRHTAVSEPTGIAPTQELGKALFATGTEGFRAISAKVPYQKTLTVFTDNLRTGSSLTFTDPSGNTYRIP
jgi:RES domain-containing protein